MNTSKSNSLGKMLKIFALSILLGFSLAGSQAYAWGHGGFGGGFHGGFGGGFHGGWGWGQRYYPPAYGFRPYYQPYYQPRTFVVPLPQVYPRYYSSPYYYPYSYSYGCRDVWDGYEYVEVCN